MNRAHTPLVIGNWKMNPTTKQSARRLYKDVQSKTARLNNIVIAVAPPTIFLPVLDASKRVHLSAQDAHFEKVGPHTGGTSVLMLKDANVAYVILGHSERRAEGETDEMVNKKVHAVLKAGLAAVVCVGEQKRDAAGRYLSNVEKQVQQACAGVPRSKLSKLVVAYEPIWAISSGDGKGKTATPDDAHEMKIFIQKTLTRLYGRSAAARVLILYGGSVNARNAKELLKGSTVDGFLVGGASLRADEFGDIVKIVHTHAR